MQKDSCKLGSIYSELSDGILFFLLLEILYSTLAGHAVEKMGMYSVHMVGWR